MRILYHHRTRAEEVEGVHIRGIIEGLEQLGHAVDVVAPPGVGRGSAAPAAKTSAPALNASAPAPSPAKPKVWSRFARSAPEELFETFELAYNAYAAPALLAKTLQHRYDFIYERYALFLEAGVQVARIRGLPLVLEVNDASLVDRIRKLKWQGLARRLECDIWRRADVVVTITDTFADIITAAGVPAEKVHVIPNAVDHRTFVDTTALDAAAAKERQRFGLDGPVIGYVGAINYWRRLDLLVDAFAKLAPRHPKTKLLLVGDGPDREDVREKMAALGLSSRVIFAGRVSHVDIPALLRAIDIAVLPHSNDYGSPMKLFEYLAAGCAVVAPRLSPVTAILGDDADTIGRAFAPLSVDELTRAIDGLLTDNVAATRLRARARSTALARYTWLEHSRTILDLVAKQRQSR